MSSIISAFHSLQADITSHLTLLTNKNDPKLPILFHASLSTLKIAGKEDQPAPYFFAVNRQ